MDMENGLLDTYVSSFPLPLEALYKNHDRSKFGQIVFKGLRLTAGRRPTWVCVGLGPVSLSLFLSLSLSLFETWWGLY